MPSNSIVTWIRRMQERSGPRTRTTNWGCCTRHVVGLYDSARVAYNEGEMPKRGQTLTVTPLLTRRADYMIKYAAFSSEIRKMDSLRIYWLTPRDTVALARTASRRTHRVAKTLAVADSGKAKVPQLPPLPLDSVLARMASAKSELATLFYTAIGRTDSALFWYHSLITDHPQRPAWSRGRSSALLRSTARIPPWQGHRWTRSIISWWIDTRRSQYAAVARRELGLAAAIVSPDTAEMLYHQAEKAMLAGRNENAIDTLTDHCADVSHLSVRAACGVCRGVAL